jgi:shikimate kinase
MGKKIFLIGLMGAGKSFWKNHLCNQYQLKGYDLDFMIESFAEKTISEIFQEKGEVVFRQKEAALLRWFQQSSSFVLATGGGTPCFHGNMDWMNQQGITIWIDDTSEVLAERLRTEKEHRPLISQLSDNELIAFLENMRLERSPFYFKAAHHLQGKEISDASFQKILGIDE